MNHIQTLETRDLAGSVRDFLPVRLQDFLRCCQPAVREVRRGSVSCMDKKVAARLLSRPSGDFFEISQMITSYIERVRT